MFCWYDNLSLESVNHSNNVKRNKKIDDKIFGKKKQKLEFANKKILWTNVNLSLSFLINKGNLQKILYLGEGFENAS